MPDRAVDRTQDNPFTPRDARVGDFYAPFFTIRFLTAEPQQGTDVDKTGAETTVEIPEANSIVVHSGNTTTRFTSDQRTSQFRSYATSLVVTNQGGGACTVEVRLEPPLEDALVMIEQRAIQFNSVMIVEWGWTSNEGQDSLISDKHYFVMMPPQMDVKGTDVSITLTGIDLFGYSAMKRETRRVYKRTSKSPTNIGTKQTEASIKATGDPTIYDTDFKILQAVAKKNNMHVNSTLAPQVIVATQAPVGLLRVPTIKVTATQLPIHTKHPINEHDATSVEQNEKDWVFFKRICDSNRCDFFTVGNTIFIVDQNIARVQKGYAYRLVFWNQPQKANDIPIYSFTTQALPQLFFPAEAKETQCKSADEDNGKAHSSSYDPQAMADLEAMGKRGAGGKGEADGRSLRFTDDVQLIPNPKFASDETGRMMSCPHGRANRDESIKRIVRDANTTCNTSMEVSIPGMPGMVPMQIVNVAGVSKVFSGPYLVLKVVHKLTTDGYDCDVTLQSEHSTGDDVAGHGQRPQTGGNDPPKGPDGQGVSPVDGGTAG